MWRTKLASLLSPSLVSPVSHLHSLICFNILFLFFPTLSLCFYVTVNKVLMRMVSCPPVPHLLSDLLLSLNSFLLLFLLIIFQCSFLLCTHFLSLFLSSPLLSLFHKSPTHPSLPPTLPHHHLVLPSS